MRLTVRETARLLRVSEKTVYRWVRSGNLPAYRLNEQYRFNRAELLEWATSRRLSVAPECFDETDRSGTSSVRLFEALARGGIHYRVAGSDKPGVLAEVVRIMRLPEGIDRGFLLSVLMAREELASTGVGDGIAIPHVRHPMVLHVDEPLITLCFLERPVDFGALDGHPVHTLFTLITPTVRTHLGLLSRLAFALKNLSFRAAVQRQALRDELLSVLREVEAQWADHPQAREGE